MSTLDITIQKKLDKGVKSLIRHSQTKSSFHSFDTITFTEFLADKPLLISIIREGVPYSFFELVQRIAPFNDNDWADFLDISTKSLQRYKESARHFKPIQTEKIIEMAEVSNIGLDVFGSMEKFKLWLDTPNYALGKLKPMELLKDSYGKEMVIGELTRINYGILA
jgi:putative toxin-antitoxin system antitoxin component (TIGR02293 family)